MGVNPYDRQAAWKAERQRQAGMEARAAKTAAAKAQANAKETISATGRHHRKDGK
jgi:hypothetical protein